MKNFTAKFNVCADTMLIVLRFHKDTHGEGFTFWYRMLWTEDYSYKVQSPQMVGSVEVITVFQQDLNRIWTDSR